MLGYILACIGAATAWAIADATRSRDDASSTIAKWVTGGFLALVAFNTFSFVFGFFSFFISDEEVEPVPDVSTMTVQTLPVDKNGNGYLIVVPGQKNAEGDTTYRITVKSKDDVLPWVSCYTEVVGQVKSIDGEWTLLDVKPRDISGYIPPNDLSTTFYGPLGKKGSSPRGWMFDSWFNLTETFQHKPMVIKVECS